MQVYTLAGIYLVSMSQALEVVRSLGIEAADYRDTLSDADAARVREHFEATYERRPATQRYRVRRACGSCGG